MKWNFFSGNLVCVSINCQRCCTQIVPAFIKQIILFKHTTRRVQHRTATPVHVSQQHSRQKFYLTFKSRSQLKFRTYFPFIHMHENVLRLCVCVVFFSASINRWDVATRKKKSNSRPAHGTNYQTILDIVMLCHSIARPRTWQSSRYSKLSKMRKKNINRIGMCWSWQGVRHFFLSLFHLCNAMLEKSWRKVFPYQVTCRGDWPSSN